MGIWIGLVLAGQFLNAVVALVDKYIVTAPSALPRPFVYAFYVSILSAGSVLVFFLSWIPVPYPDLAIPSFARVARPTLLVASLSLVAAYAFFYALVSLFSALKEADASDVAPVVGAMSALGAFALSVFFLEENFGALAVPVLLLLAFGTRFLSHFRFTWRVALACVHAGVLFALHYVAIKSLFQITTFDNGFFWSRMAIALVALSMLLIPRYFEKITAQTKQTGARSGMLVVGNKVVAGVASLLILKAVDFGNVAVVQGLAGMQYVFLLVLGIALGPYLRRECGERCGERDMLRKSFAVSVIVLGFFFLFL